MTFVSYVKGTVPDELGHFPMTEVTVDAPGCRHRPLSFSETAEFTTDIATEAWRSTIPISEYSPTLQATVMNAKSNSVIRVGGRTFQIIGGTRPHPDGQGKPFKATIISQIKTG